MPATVTARVVVLLVPLGAPERVAVGLVISYTKDWVAVALLPAVSSTVPAMETVPSVSVVSCVRVRVVVHVFEETAMSLMDVVLEPLVKVRSTSEPVSAPVVVPDTVTPLLSSVLLT